MLDRRKAGRLAAVLAALGIILAASIGLAVSHYNKKPISIKGAVVKQDSDPMKESPITGVEISDASGLAVSGGKSNFTGFFAIPLRRGVSPNQIITLKFRHPDYQPLDLTEPVDDKLSVVRLVPIHKEADIPANRPLTSIANILIRYTTVTTTQENIGTEARTFEIPNKGNLPCNKSAPCSPDGKWKAAVAGQEIDAGEGSVFRNARVSCIAGPCPFTRVDLDGFTQGGRHIKVVVRNWSDTTTFLLQAEVYRPQINNIVRTGYPVILGTSLNFTLPPAADGPSIQAEVNGENIVFPLGPSPFLSWALCNVSIDKNQAKIFRCDLKSGYGFRESK